MLRRCFRRGPAVARGLGAPHTRPLGSTGALSDAVSLNGRPSPRRPHASDDTEPLSLRLALGACGQSYSFGSPCVHSGMGFVTSAKSGAPLEPRPPLNDVLEVNLAACPIPLTNA
jgi:hypothetical protein